MPAQSSRSIGFLMPVGSSLTLCGIICNNKAMLSPGFWGYDPSKSNYALLVTIAGLWLRGEGARPHTAPCIGGGCGIELE